MDRYNGVLCESETIAIHINIIKQYWYFIDEIIFVNIKETHKQI